MCIFFLKESGDFLINTFHNFINICYVEKSSDHFVPKPPVVSHKSNYWKIRKSGLQKRGKETEIFNTRKIIIITKVSS